MTTSTADAVICGAGIAGISAAYHLAVRCGLRRVILVDERDPLSLTSDKSTEAYRNWWPGPGDDMVRFMNRSIDLLEQLADESGNQFLMNRRGYAFLTADADTAQQMRAGAEETSRLGAGPLRIHPGPAPYVSPPAEGFKEQPDGADLLLDRDLIQQQFPFVSEETVALLHPRRCGWLSAQQLGMYLLQQARAGGVELLAGKVRAVSVEKNRVRVVQVDERHISTDAFIIAAGPLLAKAGSMIGVDFPVFNELHGKISFDDYLNVVPRNAPLTIWNDPLELLWSDEEREELATDPETQWLLDKFPAGVHFRPEGGEHSNVLLALWTYDVEVMEPVWPVRFDPFYPEIVLRGLARMVPELARYIGRMRNLYVDGGYYCKTRENRPLVGSLPVAGAYVLGALSGYGIMASQAAAELLAGHVTGGSLPDYAPAFALSRYEDPAYRKLLENWDSGAGQL